MFARLFKVRVLRALKVGPEPSSSNSSEILIRPISITNFEIITFTLQGLLCKMETKGGWRSDPGVTAFVSYANAQTEVV